MLPRISLVIALLAAGCTDAPPGRKLASGIAARLSVSKSSAAFLVGAAHPDDRTVPEDLLAGDLWFASSFEGAAHKVGAGVSSQPGAFAFSPRGDSLAYLASWRFRAGAGELWVAAPEPVQVSAAASEFAWSPDGAALAYVAPARLGIWRGRESLSVAIEGLQSVAWSPDGRQIAARAGASAGGKLWLVDAAKGDKREIAPGTSDFAFASDGTLAALGPPGAKGGDRPLLVDGKELGKATAFGFSPSGRELALLSTAKQPGEATGELYRLTRASSQTVLVGSKASDWRFDAAGDLIFLDRYDLRARAGVLTVAPPGEPPRALAKKVQSFVVDGRRVHYLVQAPQKGDFKIELWEVDLGAAPVPRKIDEGVYGWQLSPDGALLYYKARCAGGPRSCSLLRVAGVAEPTFLAANVAGFELSQDGSRVLLLQPHRGATRAVDLALIPATGAPPEHVKPFVEEADASARFADAAGKRVVYAVVAGSEAGVYAADIP